jgi:hypothetical protein
VSSGEHDVGSDERASAKWLGLVVRHEIADIAERSCSCVHNAHARVPADYFTLRFKLQFRFKLGFKFSL